MPSFTLKNLKKGAWGADGFPCVFSRMFMIFMKDLLSNICSITPFEVLPDPFDTWPAPFANTTNTRGQGFILPAAKSVSNQAAVDQSATH